MRQLTVLFFLFFALFSLSAQDVVRDTLNFGNVSKSSPGTLYNLTGKVVDEQGVSVIGATIEINEISGGTITDDDGKFQLRFPSGAYTISFKYLGYKTSEILVGLYSNAKLNVEMVPSSFQLEQVVITDQSEERNIEEVIMGVETMDIKRLETRGQLFGETDVLRSIQSLSGVTSVGDGASGFNVRGGNSDENLILQDDALIVNPTHTLGFFSLFHPDLIGSVDLYKGNQPAYHGGRLSSVLKVGLREGDKEKLKVKGGVGMVASRLTLEGPIQKGKSSFIIGGRVSYMDYLLNAVKNVDVKNSRTFFYDITAKADARITKNTKVGFTAFVSGDDFQFAEEVNFDYATKTGTFYLNQLLSDQWNLRATVNVGDYESSLFDIQGDDLSRFTNRVAYMRSSLRSFYQFSDDLEFIAGAEYDVYNVSPGELSPEGQGSTAIPEILPEEKGVALAPFLQLDWSPSEKLSLSVSGRMTQYRRLGPGSVPIYLEGARRTDFNLIENRSFSDGEEIASFNGLEPRVSIRYSLNENSSIKAGYNRGFQYLNQVSNTASSTPVDIWKLSDVYATPQRANNYNLGFFQNLNDNKVQTSIETFYRNQDRIIEYRDFADLLLNPNLERELVDGVGRSYGVEANFKLKKEGLSWEVNYTYSRALRKVVASETQDAINDGDWFPSNFDKPHSLNVNFTKKTGRITSLSLNFTYSTGRPITAPISNFRVDNILNVPIFSERNQFRIPDYHRLDFSYTVGPFGNPNKDFKQKLVFSVYNVYSRKNAYSVFFRQAPSRGISVFRIATLGTIFPSVTYNFEF